MFPPIPTSLLVAQHDAWLEEMRKEPLQGAGKPVRLRAHRRLLSETRAGRVSWLSRQRGRAACQLGQFFVSLGERLLQDASPQPFPREDKVAGRA